MRTKIFISHATPEDSELAKWFAQQLTRAGFDVWVDLNEFTGGEYMLSEIETTLREKTRLFILLASEESIAKPGVLNELNLASQIEREDKDAISIQGVCIEGLAFSKLPMQISRKNAYDLTEGWRQIFEKLVRHAKKMGLESSGERQGAHALSNLYDIRSNFKTEFSDIPEPLYSNWLQIKELPRKINFLRFKGAQGALKKIENNDVIPVVRNDRLFLTFADTPDFLALPDYVDYFEHAYQYDVDEFFEEQKSIHGWNRNVRKIHLARLLNKSIQIELRQRGLQKYNTSNPHQPAWVFTEENFPEQKVKIKCEGERASSVSVFNAIDRGKISWHLGLSLQSMTSEPLRFVIKLHVIFADSKGNFIDSTDKQHTLRRSRCKSWNNRRWRNFNLAAVSWLAGGKSEWNLRLCDTASINIAGAPFTFDCPVSFVDPSNRQEKGNSDEGR